MQLAITLSLLHSAGYILRSCLKHVVLDVAETLETMQKLWQHGRDRAVRFTCFTKLGKKDCCNRVSRHPILNSLIVRTPTPDLDSPSPELSYSIKIGLFVFNDLVYLFPTTALIYSWYLPDGTLLFGRKLELHSLRSLRSQYSL